LQCNDFLYTLSILFFASKGDVPKRTNFGRKPWVVAIRALSTKLW